MVMKMKQKKWQKVIFLLLGCLMLTGCGEAPYELTEEEQQLIVSYSAHVVSKFNRYQKDGLTYVPDEEEVLESEQPETPSETEQPEDKEQNTGDTSGGVASGDERPGTETTLNTVYADTGLTFTYLGNDVTASYMESNIYSVNAGVGKKLLVLKWKVENQTEKAITIDNMSSNDEFSAKYVMESGKSYNAKSVLTLLSNDFTTYEGIIAPEEAVEMVIVFEIPSETEKVGEVQLKIEKNGKLFQINL